MSYRPHTDLWILCRGKVKFYGSYPAGSLERMRTLMGVGPADPILHVCSGKVRDYPGPHGGIYYPGLGENDRTLDINPKLEPDYLQDARAAWPLPPPELECGGLWPAILADPPYTEDDADHYEFAGREKLPTPNELVKRAMEVLHVGGRFGILHYAWPKVPKNAKTLAVVAVTTGENNRMRQFTVIQKKE